MAPGNSDTKMMTMMTLSICLVMRRVDFAQREAEHRHAEHPADAAEDVEADEPAVAHLADAGDDGRERAEEGQEAGDDDRLAAVAFVERLGAKQVFLREEAATSRGVKIFGPALAPIQ